MRTVLAKMDSFVDGRLVPAGFTVPISDDVEISTGKDGNFEEIEGDLPTPDRIQISAIAPTGPNPTAPQQIAPDMVQSIEGYVKPGAIVVGEVTKPAEQRIEIVGLDDNQGTEEQAAEALEAAKEGSGSGEGAGAGSGQNDDDALVAGTVPELQKQIATADIETLNTLEAAEKDREKPRVGVTSAIEARRAELNATS